jgi:hypothetical protein
MEQLRGLSASKEGGGDNDQRNSVALYKRSP